MISRNSKEVILVGAFRESIELCELCDFIIIGIIDNLSSDKFCDYNIIGKDADAEAIFRKYKSVPLVIIPDLPIIRKNLVVYYSNFGFSFASVISPKAEVSRSAKLGIGVMIQSGVNLSSDCNIGDFVKVNTHANVMHDSTIKEFTTIAPNAVVLGGVNIGSECYIGANSTILPRLVLGDKIVVGAGSVVTKSHEGNCVIAGNPANSDFKKKY